MAYDKENRRLYVDESSDKGGITLWQIMDCLRYYKLDKKGRRNLGMIIKNAEINRDSLFKPYEIDTPTIGKTVFRNGGPDGMYGYIIPMTTNDNVRDLWGKTWIDKGTPTKFYNQFMFDGYSHLASYDLYPFGFRLTQAGSQWSFEYITDTDAFFSVSPSLMEKFKTFYPAMQVFEQDTAATGPKTTAMYNWCGSNPIGSGSSGELVGGLELEDGKTYYVIPFLSQYKFTSQAGDMGTLNGEKYCLIYKDFNEDEWIIGYNAPQLIYDLTFDAFNVFGSYGAQVDFTLIAGNKIWQALPYGGYRIYIDLNGEEVVWKDKWNTFDYKYTPLNGESYISLPAGSTQSRYITFSWEGEALPSNATRIEVRIFDPSHSGYQWTKSYDL